MKTRYCSLITVVVMTLAATISQSQAIRTESDAANRAKEVLSNLHLDYDTSSLKCEPQKDSKGATVSWMVEPSLFGWFVEFRARDGLVTAFSDSLIQDEIGDRKPGTVKRTITTDEEAWQVADKNLEAFGYKGLEFGHGEIKKLADLPGADKDTNNTAYRYEMNSWKSVKDYPGHIDSMNMTIDVVTGKPLLFKGPSFVTFEMPASTMSKSNALKRIKAIMEDQRSKYSDEGDTVNAEIFKWPGDSEVEPSLALGVIQCQGAVLGSPFGAQMAEQRKARLVWGASIGAVSIGTDAENGEPLFLAISKSSPQPDGGRSKSFFNSASKLDRSQANPRHPSDSKRNVVIGGGVAGGLAVAGIGIAAAKRARGRGK